MNNHQVVAVVCRGYSYGIPYNHSFFHISRALEKIAEQIAQAYLTRDVVAADDFRQAYIRFLTLCGWTEEDYNLEMLNRIDSTW